MRLPPMPVARRKAVCALARQPLAVVRVDQLPRIWGTTGDFAAGGLRSLAGLGLVAAVPDPGGMPRRVMLTRAGAEAAGVVPAPGGCRWVRFDCA